LLNTVNKMSKAKLSKGEVLEKVLGVFFIGTFILVSFWFSGKAIVYVVKTLDMVNAHQKWTCGDPRNAKYVCTDKNGRFMDIILPIPKEKKVEPRVEGEA